MFPWALCFRSATRASRPMSVHQPVLLQEAVEYLSPPPDGVVLDLTVGMGGHSTELLKRLPKGRLIGVDQDVDALQHAGLALRGDPRVSLFKANFANLLWVLKDLDVKEVDSVLMDIGISSYQLDTPSRGFSFMHEGPLDMRMDQAAGFTASEIINNSSEQQLSKIFFEFGEEPKARALSRAIVKARAEEPIRTTSQLAELAKRVLGRPRDRAAKHPATKLFQALRIAVNRELEVLQKGLKSALSVLKPGGRIAVITFHSLEDRIVKQLFKAEATDCICPPEIPMCVCGHKASLKLITHKPLTASEEELALNPRSRSAKLRVAEKLTPGGPV